MISVRCADEFIIRCIHQVPDPFDLSGYVVHEFLRRDPRLIRFQLDLLTMLICTCLEEHVISLTSLVTRDSVRKDDLIRVPDVRLARCVGDRRSDVILWFLIL